MLVISMKQRYTTISKAVRQLTKMLNWRIPLDVFRLAPVPLGIVLGVTDADRASIVMGVMFCERCLERLSLDSALWLRLDSASTFPRFRTAVESSVLQWFLDPLFGVWAGVCLEYPSLISY